MTSETGVIAICNQCAQVVAPWRLLDVQAINRVLVVYNPLTVTDCSFSHFQWEAITFQI